MRRDIRPVTALVCVTVGLMVSGCGSDDDAPAAGSPTPVASFDAKALIDNVVGNVVVATYTDLDTRAASLLTAVQALQDGGATEPELDAAQTGWRATRVPWEASEGFLFGPVDSLGIDPAIDSWPLNTPDLAAYIASNPDPTQADVENAGDDLRGFHAIEYLLFGDGVTDNDRAASELTDGERAYLVALTGAFKARTAQLSSSWTTDFNGQGAYRDLVKTAGSAGNAVYASARAVLEELVNGIAGIVDEVNNAKIAEPLGTSIAAADTSKVESQYSWNSLTDFHNNVQSVLNIYTGQAGFDARSSTVSATSPGVYAFVASQDQALADRVLAEIVAAQQQIALIKGDGDNQTTVITGTARPFRDQIANDGGRALIANAKAALTTLQNSLVNDVLPLVRSAAVAG